MSQARAGRPRASSREMLAEAACELFLEQGYAATSIADIASRAGVSRSSFFNYVDSKADLLWGGLDERIGEFGERLQQDRDRDLARVLRRCTAALAEGLVPDSLALAITHADAMGISEEIGRESALRRARIGGIVADRAKAGGLDALTAAVTGAAYAGAVLAALEQWAVAGPGSRAFGDVLGAALDCIATIPVSPPPEADGGSRDDAAERAESR